MRSHILRIPPVWAGLLLLLVLCLGASPSHAARRNVAAAVNGGLATASSQYNSYYQAAGVNNGSRAFNNGSTPIPGADGGWIDGTPNAYSDVIGVRFPEAKTINEINVVGAMDDIPSTSLPSLSTIGTKYSLIDFDVQYLKSDGTYDIIPGGQVRGNNKVLCHFDFAATPITTSYVRIAIYKANSANSRVAEIEAWEVNDTTPATPVPTGTNVALANLGASAVASSTATDAAHPEYSFNVGSVLDGDRSGRAWQNGGAWSDGTSNAYPDWVEITFPGNRTIHEVDVFSVQSYYQNAVEPTPEMRTTLGLTNFQVQYWDGTAWAAAPGGTVSNNDLVWRRVVLTSPVITSKIRVYVTSAMANSCRIAEIECWATNAQPAVSIVRPVANTSENPLTPGYEVEIEALANDPDGTIAKVEFYAVRQQPSSTANAPYNTMTKIGEATTPSSAQGMAQARQASSVDSYTITWVPTVGGDYWLYAVAYDDQGGTNNPSSESGAPSTEQDTRVSATVRNEYPGHFSVEDAGTLYDTVIDTTGGVGEGYPSAEPYHQFYERGGSPYLFLRAGAGDKYDPIDSPANSTSAVILMPFTHAIRVIWNPTVAGQYPPKKVLVVRYGEGEARALIWPTEYYDGGGSSSLATSASPGFGALTMTLGTTVGSNVTQLGPAPFVSEVELGMLPDGRYGGITTMSDVVSARIQRQGKVDAFAYSALGVWVHSVGLQHVDGDPNDSYGDL